MKLYEVSVRKPITTLLIFIGVILFGLYSFHRLPVDMYPEIEPPFVTVFTYYQGANAADIETNISKLLEDNLNTVPNLKEIRSTSRDNFSLVALEFEWGIDLDEATNSIRDALSRIQRRLPEGIDPPTIFKFNTNLIPILEYSVTATESFAALPDILEDVVANPLNRVDGVGAIQISGGGERQLMIDVDPLRLEAYNLTVEQIGALVAQENTNVPAGTIDLGQTTMPLRIEGEFHNAETVANLVVGQFQGAPIYLRDVATVKDSLAKQTFVERRNGQRAVRIFIQKQSGANTVKVVKEIQKEMPRLIRNLPADVDVQEVFSVSEIIEDSINSLSETVLFAALFVVLVVLFFLGRWRATFIIALTIPVSLIAAFIYLHISGNTINIISLSSLSIAIGMVVDDAIVVLENVTTHLEQGSSPRESAIYGTNEVALAVMASTLTVIAVFFPLTMVEGFSGIMFRQLGASVTLVVAVSIVAALSLTPMLASRLLKRRDPEFREAGNAVQRGINNFLNNLSDLYARLLRWATGHRVWVIVVSLVIFVASLFLLPHIRTEFMPVADNSRIKMTCELAMGVRVEYTGALVDRLEQRLLEDVPEINLLATSYGSAGSSNIFAAFGTSGSHVINMDLRLVKPGKRDKDMFAVAEAVRQIMGEYPEIEKLRVIPGGGQGGAGDAPLVDVNIIGHDMDVTTQIAEDLAAKMREIPGLRDVDIRREPYKREFDVQFDREKLALHGMNTSTASYFVRNRINGLIATKFRESGNEYDVVVRYAEEHRQSLEDIENITLYTPQGRPFKLRDVAEVRQIFAPPAISRENRQRIVKIRSMIYNASLDKVVDAIWDSVDELEIPQSVGVSIGGSAKEQAESNEALGMLLLLVIILVYIVMASQFESLKEPFIIMLSLPFAFTGVLLSLWLFDQSLNLVSIIGAIMLVGIVVKNGIVLVDYTNLLRERGYSTMRAISDAGRSRLRPVLMTSLTTMLGMLPLAVSHGEGAEVWRPMGIAVIGGLLFSTLLTLLVVPSVYAVFAGTTIRSIRRKHRKSIGRRRRRNRLHSAG